MPPFASDDDRWRAISTRDATADGIFIYGVRTTRIYCRPNCKARLARRANVVYFDGAGSAEAEGYRACKRCKPAAVGTMPEDEAVARIRSLVAAAANSPDAHSTRNPDGSMKTEKRGAARLATQARVSRWHFHRKFKQVTGMTPRAYLKKRESDALAREQAKAGTVECEEATPVESDHGYPESLSATPLLPLDEISDWFDFGTLMTLTQCTGLDGAHIGGETIDMDGMANFDEYLDGIDPCLL
ncbi:dna repair and transcription factor [Ophiostoma piceae UAMH 11346]|uniref:Dna repair and transcription factor n=1 Tax=Ophiostoma piceae (strain UAMH 11346) TaxID=1262450 RepID=S3CB03_OPHP1|nr:dna repair and transcription factor [Ophiostoma piceae UAMH 11346]